MAIAEQTAALAFQGICKGFGPQQVLKGVDFTVAPGEIFALVGANGAGKTTLLKGLLDLCAMDRGAILLFGMDHRHPPARNRVAYLPERFAPPHYLTGHEFLALMLDLYQAGGQGEQARQIALQLDLAPQSLHQPVRTLSKGMTQKLGLTACLASDKPLLILDEPMSGLDPKARFLLRRQLLHLRQQGRTLFFNTHLLADVESLCNRLAILHEGLLRFVGSPEECRQRFAAPTLEEAYLNAIG